MSKLLSMSAEDRFERKRIFFEKIFSMFFGLGSNISGIFSKLFLIGWPNCRWKSPGEHFENNVFFEKNLFQTLRQKRSEKGKFLRLRSLNCIKRDQKNILRFFFCGLGTYSLILGLLAETSVCQNCFQLALRIVLKKNFFFQSTCFFPYTLDLEPYFKVCGQNVSCDVSKLHFAFPKNRSFEEEQVLEKLIAFFSNSELELKRFWLL